MTTQEELHKKIIDVPFMNVNEGILFENHIVKYNIKNVLELGFYHGTSTCYLANALLQTGGAISTIDIDYSITHTPNIYDLLKRCDLNNVAIYLEQESFTWRLMHMIEDNYKFDMVFIDAAHTWEDGYAFFLADKLLLPGGWMIFDDYLWCEDGVPKEFISTKNRKNRYDRFTKEYNDEYNSTPQIKKIIDLLVRPHPNYDIKTIYLNKYVFVQKRLVE